MVVHSSLVGSELHYPLGHSTAGVLTLVASSATAYRVTDSAANNLILIDTNAAPDTITLGNATTNPTFTWLGTGAFTISGASFVHTGTTIDLDPTSNFTLDMDATRTITITMADNVSSSFLLQEGSNNYLRVNTANSSEVVIFGNTTTNPTYRFSGSGEIQFNNLANGQYWGPGAPLTESHTLAAAATSDTAILIPANAYVFNVVIRVTTLITGCTTLDVGIAGATTRYGTGLALTSGTTNVGPDSGGSPRLYTAATAIRFTAIGGGASFTAGVIRVSIFYTSATAPTS